MVRIWEERCIKARHGEALQGARIVAASTALEAFRGPGMLYFSSGIVRTRMSRLDGCD